MSQQPQVLAASEDDVLKMLAAGVHLGTRNYNIDMERYIWRRRADGVCVFDLNKTWQKLVLAARVIVAIENAEDVCIVSGRQLGQRGALKFAKYTGGSALAGRYTPGSFTNQIEQRFSEPRLLIICDPLTDKQALKESSYVNVPTIAFCNSDSPLNNVDIAIPCNNASKHSLGLMMWLLCREVLYLRNSTVTRQDGWDVMPDLFFFRDAEDIEKDELAAKEAEAAAAAADAAADGWQQDDAAQAQSGAEWAASTPMGEAAAIPATGAGQPYAADSWAQ